MTRINLNKLIRATNALYKEQDLIQFEFTDENDLRVSHGEVVCFLGLKDIMEVVATNEIDPRDEHVLYDTLAKYIVNQLSASLGRKAFPEIKSISSSIIK